MGMFDYIRVLYPMPKGAPKYGWQTKDTPAQYLELYDIREDGSFWHVPNEADPTQLMLTQSVDFYTYEDVKNCAATWWEFRAVYDGGQLVSLTEIDTPNTRAADQREGGRE